MSKNMLPVWYLPGPFFRYEGDVKELAARARVRIVDANAMSGDPADWPDRAPDDQLPIAVLRPEYAAAEGAHRVAAAVAGEFKKLSPEQQAEQLQRMEAHQAEQDAEAKAAAAKLAAAMGDNPKPKK